MFKKLKERLLTVETVLDAVTELLHKKAILTREEIQLEILARSGGEVKLGKRVKLYQLPRKKGIKIYGFDIMGEPEGTAIIFGSIDGMYSVCWVDGKPDKIVHLSATTPLIKYKDGYRLEEE